MTYTADHIMVSSEALGSDRVQLKCKEPLVVQGCLVGCRAAKLCIQSSHNSTSGKKNKKQKTGLVCKPQDILFLKSLQAAAKEH